MKQNILKYGTMAGVGAVGYLLLFYYTNREWLFTGTFYFSSLLIYLFFMYQAAKTVAKEDFKTILKVALSTFLIANALYYIGDFWLYNKMDTSLADLQKTKAIEYLKQGTPIGEQLKMTETVMTENIHDAESLIKLYIRGIIGGFGMAVLVSYLIKRNF
jgi:hypothetical protein